MPKGKKKKKISVPVPVWLASEDPHIKSYNQYQQWNKKQRIRTTIANYTHQNIEREKIKVGQLQEQLITCSDTTFSRNIYQKNNYFVPCIIDPGGGRCKEDAQDPFFGGFTKL